MLQAREGLLHFGKVLRPAQVQFEFIYARVEQNKRTLFKIIDVCAAVPPEVYTLYAVPSRAEGVPVAAAALYNSKVVEVGFFTVK